MWFSFCRAGIVSCTLLCFCYVGSSGRDTVPQWVGDVLPEVL